MKKIWAIAKHTFQEAARDRVLYGLIAFAFLYIFLDIFFAQLSLGDMVMIKSFGLAGIYLFGLIVTVFLGASVIHKEIERRTLYFVLSKPVSRAELLIGKFLGLLMAVIGTIALMGLVYLGVVVFQGGGFDSYGFLAIVLQMLEMTLLTALMVFFSSMIRPLTSTICSVLLLFAGHLLPTVLENARNAGRAAYYFASTLYYILPNLDKFDIRTEAAHGFGISVSTFFSATAYAIAYTALLLFLAIKAFKRREL